MKQNLLLISLITLFGGLITGTANKLGYKAASADWASNGQSFMSRWLDTQEVFIKGMPLGLIIGFTVSIFVIIYIKNNDSSNI
jgi:hypothetical protein